MGGGRIRSKGIFQPKAEGENIQKRYERKPVAGGNAGIQPNGNEETLRKDDKRKFPRGGFISDADAQGAGGNGGGPAETAEFH